MTDQAQPWHERLDVTDRGLWEDVLNQAGRAGLLGSHPQRLAERMLEHLDAVQAAGQMPVRAAADHLVDGAGIECGWCGATLTTGHDSDGWETATLAGMVAHARTCPNRPQETSG